MKGEQVVHLVEQFGNDCKKAEWQIFISTSRNNDYLRQAFILSSNAAKSVQQLLTFSWCADVYFPQTH